MLYLFRVFYVTLLTLFTALIFPGFEIGGKYHVLFYATMTTFLLQIIRLAVRRRLPNRERSLVTGLGVFISILLVDKLFQGVKPGLTGILLLYLGIVLMEMLLPEEPEVFLNKKHQTLKNS